MSARLTVLILGGYGTFGGRLGELLRALHDCATGPVTVASRSACRSWV